MAPWARSRRSTHRLRTGWVAAALAAAIAACSSPRADVEPFGPDGSPVEPVVARRGSVVVEACSLDASQVATLGSATTRKVVREVVLRCPSVDGSGATSPPTGDERGRLDETIASLQALGYRVSLAFGLGHGISEVDGPGLSAEHLADASWRAKAVDSLLALAAGADGLEFAPPQLTNAARDGVTALIAALAAAKPQRLTLGAFLPPSVRVPSDIAGGDSFDLAALAPYLGRARVMTLDYSCCGAQPGPTTDPGWALDAVRLASSRLPSSIVLDVSYPLYGTDFGPRGEGPVTYAQAAAVATAARADVERGPSGAPFFSYQATDGSHVVWYDDRVSTVRTLRAWGDGALDTSVGVTFYGLGAEDPALFATIAAAGQ